MGASMKVYKTVMLNQNQIIAALRIYLTQTGAMQDASSKIEGEIPPSMRLEWEEDARNEELR